MQQAYLVCRGNLEVSGGGHDVCVAYDTVRTAYEAKPRAEGSDIPTQHMRILNKGQLASGQYLYGSKEKQGNK